ncbi:DUF1254 domain-containing protein [Marinobacter fonticola]|uniref:DUF1254 domain-containing protein n=1 Tax=Marinobacter fonticola TaxID=2603215 RepID=UPI00143CDE0D|nr:DUF1254 domain-containing protein [Marinobacter fonticola]
MKINKPRILAIALAMGSLAQPVAAQEALPADFVPQYELGVPTDDTAQKMFDELAYQRAVQVYLWGLPAVGMQQYRIANAEGMGGGSDAWKLGYLGDLMKVNIKHLTGNPDSMYIDYFFDTHEGPIAMEVPPKLTGMIDDMWEKPVIDIIPSVSESGKYLIVPPEWEGDAPEDFVVVRPATYVSWMLLRGNVEQTDDGPDTSAAVELMKTGLKIYPLSAMDAPSERPTLQYFNMSDKVLNRIPPEGLAYFERLAEVVESEPLTQTDAFAMGLMKAIGIEPGEAFAPDDRMKKLLERAAVTGQAMARSIAFKSDGPAERWHWPDRYYAEAFMGGSPTFEIDGHTNHDARTYFFYLACGTSQLMSSTTPGVGQAYPWGTRDADGEQLDGGQSYRMHLPADIPAKLYWSVTVYDTETRSQLDNGSEFARISTFTEPKQNEDGSYDLYFGPEEPDGEAANWVKTVPGKGWFFLFRLYGPEQPYFDRSWKPDDLVKLN